MARYDDLYSRRNMGDREESNEDNNKLVITLNYSLWEYIHLQFIYFCGPGMGCQIAYWPKMSS